MSNRSIALVGALLASLVALGSGLFCSETDKVNLLLQKEFEPNDHTYRATPKLEVVVKFLEAQQKRGFGLGHNRLKAGVRKFLLLANSKECTVDVALAAATMLNSNGYYDQIIKRVLEKDFWTKEKIEQCFQSIDNITKQVMSDLPKKDKLQTYMRHVNYPMDRYETIPWIHFSSWREEYEKDPLVGEEIFAIAEEKSIPLTSDKAYDEVYEKYYNDQCKLFNYLTQDIFNFVHFILERYPADFNALSQETRNLFYRKEACIMSRHFMNTIEKGRAIAQKLYAEKHQS